VLAEKDSFEVSWSNFKDRIILSKKAVTTFYREKTKEKGNRRASVHQINYTPESSNSEKIELADSILDDRCCFALGI
jgi:hypothetical protein